MASNFHGFDKYRGQAKPGGIRLHHVLLTVALLAGAVAIWVAAGAHF